MILKREKNYSVEPLLYNYISRYLIAFLFANLIVNGLYLKSMGLSIFLPKSSLSSFVIFSVQLSIPL